MLITWGVGGGAVVLCDCITYHSRAELSVQIIVSFFNRSDEASLKHLPCPSAAVGDM